MINLLTSSVLPSQIIIIIIIIVIIIIKPFLLLSNT